MASSAVSAIIDHPQFLQWTAIFLATALGLGLLAYDVHERQAKVSEKTNVKLKIEAVSSTTHLYLLQYLIAYSYTITR